MLQDIGLTLAAGQKLGVAALLSGLPHILPIIRVLEGTSPGWKWFAKNKYK